MAKAAEIAYGNMRKRVQKEIMLRNYLIERVMHEIPDAKLNGHRSIRLPGNVNFSFKGLEGASLLILLDEDGICASGGSACNTGRTDFLCDQGIGSAGRICTRHDKNHTLWRYDTGRCGCSACFIKTQYRHPARLNRRLTYRRAADFVVLS